ncbi:MAG: 3-phosphoshikimate 1-carboxyvinyltransferase [Cytophagales bacterium]|nr:3-phosphoshikimate 1-carboxyvinyltransferase [Cytophagales bacterium]
MLKHHKKKLHLSHPAKVIKGTISLPASKSESNRVLIMAALTGNRCGICNLSEASDTVILNNILNGRQVETPRNSGQAPDTTLDEDTVDVKDAGTAMRFLTAYYVATKQNKMLTGSLRMQERPIGPLVDALKELGADIRYIKKEGFPPIRINGGSNLTSANKISINAGMSSQFISALLMIAPVLPTGLRLQLAGNITSKPYIRMTLKIMEHFGIKHEWEGDIISIMNKQGQNYVPPVYTVEPDWSAASYWYSMVALADEAEITLPDLKKNSFQGDSIIAEIGEKLGVKTTFNSDEVIIRKKGSTLQRIDLDLTENPDLVQTIAVLCAAKGIALSMSGIENLRIKETDRIKALKNELSKMGAKIDIKGRGKMEIISDFGFHRKDAETQRMIFLKKPCVSASLRLNSDLCFQTYNDHRMAMAFAPLGLLANITIDEPNVVEKSYPNFWNDLRKAGFVIKFR